MGAEFTEGRGAWLLSSQERENGEGLATSRGIGYNSEPAIYKLLLLIISSKHRALMLLHGMNKSVLVRKKFCSNQGILEGFRVCEIMKKYLIE